MSPAPPDLERFGEQVVFPSIPAMFETRMRERGGMQLLFRKEKGAWRPYSGEELARRVRRVAFGLAALGVAKGDRVGIVASTRLEWVLADLAILSLGAVTVGVYPTLLADDVAYQLEHSGARLVLVEDREQLAKVTATRAKTPGLERAVILAAEDAAGADGTFAISLGDLEQRGDVLAKQDPGLVERAWRALGKDDLATIIYTSGTTGPPKGALLTHGNLTFVLASTASILPAPEGEDLGVAFLPLAHALQRVATYGSLYAGVRGAFAESVDRFMDNVRELRPTVQASVPRLWEKIHAKIQAGLPGAPLHRRLLFAWMHAAGKATIPYRRRGAPIPALLAWRWALAKRFFRGVVLPRLGLERVRFLSSGGAPIGVELLEFFYAMDILVLEGWGLTETAAPATFNTPGAFKFGTVGKPIPGCEIKIAEDGEIVVRGPGVFRGYYKNDEATREAFDPDGFFRTGDIGSFDDEGFLRITDRKKNLIVTSLGKKIAPQNLEGVFKECPYLGPCLIHGDRRKFLTAVFTLDPEEVVPWARERAILPRTNGTKETADELARHLPALAGHPAVQALVGQVVAEKNAKLASFEQVKRWAVVPDRWSVESGALTPTLKVKRKVLEERYRATLDAFYEGEGT